MVFASRRVGVSDTAGTMVFPLELPMLRTLT